MGAKRQAHRRATGQSKPRMNWAAMEDRATRKFSQLATLHELIEQGGEQAIVARAKLEQMHGAAFEDKTPGPGEYMRGDNFRGVRGKATMKKGPR